MLAAELPIKHHRQLPDEKEQILNHVAAGPTGKTHIYDQFPRVSIKLIESRRTRILAAMRWPEGETRQTDPPPDGRCGAVCRPVC